MIRNHLKVAFRNLWIRRSTSFLNVMGLSLGLATSMLMFLWIRDEQSFDRFHEQRDRIFKVYSNMDEGQGEIDTWTGAPEPWADLLKNNLPEVEEAVVFANWEHQLEINQQKFREMGCYARPALFDVFSFQVVAGDLGTALAGPDNIVISEKLARKYFGTNWRQGGRTIGQPIQIGEEQFRVSAVFADVPFQSSLKFDFVLSMESYFRERQWAKGQWGNYNFELYTRLAPQADPETVATKMLNEVKNNTRAGYPDHGIYLHPLSELYLYSNFENGRPAGGRIDYIRIFLVASVFVLIIACINYMNLVTAQSTKRAKEVGVRKVVGSNRFGLIGQFITESLLVTLLATVFAVVTVQLLLPFFNHLTDKEIAINYGAPGFWLLLSLGSVLGIGLLAGVYPAMMMSSFKVINVLKGKLVDAWRDVQLRRGMVVLQFVLSILLLIGALVVRDQIRYFKTKDLGLNRNNVILVPMRGDMNRNRQTTREELMDRNAIASLTMTNNSPLTIYNMTSDPVWEGMQEGEESIFAILTTDHHFLTTMEIPLVQGEGFAEGMPTDSTNFRYIINEEAARVMGFEDPVGKQLSFWDDRGRIIGVVNDFHFVSLHEPIKPLILRYQPEETWYLLVRPNPGRRERSFPSWKICTAGSIPAKSSFIHSLTISTSAFIKQKNGPAA